MAVIEAQVIVCDDYNIYIEDWDALKSDIKSKNYSKVICIADDNTLEHCLPVLENRIGEKLNVIVLKAGEKYKTLDTCSKVWNELLHLGADRHSLVINLGGGVVGDMGGFCAATFMRGMDFIQVPTTLLSQVDAAVGGKLGVDHGGYKNMVGLILNPKAVFVFPEFIQTLENRELFSGFAEMLKHALISDAAVWQKLKQINPLIYNDWQDEIHQSIMIKNNIVEQDPTEKGVRKLLNFGHTIGHAIESQNLHTPYPLLHGECVAIGMICEGHISMSRGMLFQAELDEIVQVVLDLYDHHPEAIMDEDELVELTKHDKKNKGNEVLCTLLNGIGEGVINCAITEEEMRAAMRYYQQL